MLFPAASAVGIGYSVASPPYQYEDLGTDSVTTTYQYAKQGRLVVIALYFCADAAHVATLERQLIGSVHMQSHVLPVGIKGLLLGPAKAASGYRADALFGQGVVLAHLTALVANHAAAAAPLAEQVAEAEQRKLEREGY